MTTLDADPDLIEARLAHERATICLTSALARHELTDEIPATIDLALPRGTRAPATSAPITWHSSTRRRSTWAGMKSTSAPATGSASTPPSARSATRPPPPPGGDRAGGRRAQALVASTRQPAIPAARPRRRDGSEGVRTHPLGTADPPVTRRRERPSPAGRTSTFRRRPTQTGVPSTSTSPCMRSRFLDRLSRSPHRARFVLKGGVLRLPPSTSGGPTGLWTSPASTSTTPSRPSPRQSSRSLPSRSTTASSSQRVRRAPRSSERERGLLGVRVSSATLAGARVSFHVDVTWAIRSNLRRRRQPCPGSSVAPSMSSAIPRDGHRREAGHCGPTRSGQHSMA